MNKKILIFFFAIGLVLQLNFSHAQSVCPLDNLKPRQVKSLESLKRIPILDNGRIKPFDSFAKNFLLLMSGRQHYQKENATQWMARFLFAPRSTFDDKIFLINHPEIPEAIQIEPSKNRRYSYHQLNAGYKKLNELAVVIQGIEPKNQSIVDKEILRVFNNLDLFTRLSGAFAFAVPHPDFTFSSSETAKILQLPEGQSYYSFYDVLEHFENLSSTVQSLNNKKPELWTNTEKDAAIIINAFTFWGNNYSDCPLGIIPTEDHDDENWLSPMDIILTGSTDPNYREEIKQLRNTTMYYWNGEQLQFDTSARAFANSVSKRLSEKEHKAADKTPLELLYNQLNLLSWARMFYAIGVIIFWFSLISEQKWMRQVTLLTTILGFVPHVLALMLRVIIMSRPPVSNLYETFIFVGAVCSVLGLVLEKINKNWLGLVVSNISGLILLIIAGKFSAEGDTMQMLVAVLNSNFWLSTHVIAITTGYAGCCVAGVVGHIYILQALSQPDNKKRLEITYLNMLGILGFGLTMSFLGTALGGIWADQSWGRFWGWDPKENGALMIVLWCAIVFHARIAKLINPLGAAVGCVLALMIVMWAWFGVNLLNVGLHSYGFTSGIANSLGIYALIEIIFLTTSILILSKKNIKF